MLDDTTEHIGYLKVAVHIPSAQSLKDKRMVLKSLKDRVHNTFNVSIAEIDGLDKWQVATLGIVMVSNDNRMVNRNLESVLSFMERIPELQICEHSIEFI